MLNHPVNKNFFVNMNVTDIFNLNEGEILLKFLCSLEEYTLEQEVFKKEKQKALSSLLNNSKNSLAVASGGLGWSLIPALPDASHGQKRTQAA